MVSKRERDYIYSYFIQNLSMVSSIKSTSFSLEGDWKGCWLNNNNYNRLLLWNGRHMLQLFQIQPYLMHSVGVVAQAHSQIQPIQEAYMTALVKMIWSRSYEPSYATHLLLPPFCLLACHPYFGTRCCTRNTTPYPAFKIKQIGETEQLLQISYDMMKICAFMNVK